MSLCIIMDNTITIGEFPHDQSVKHDDNYNRGVTIVIAGIADLIDIMILILTTRSTKYLYIQLLYQMIIIINNTKQEIKTVDAIEIMMSSAL